MIREGKFGFAEGFALLLISNIEKLFLSVPSNAVEQGKTMAWALILIVIVITLLEFWLIAELMKNFRDRTIVEASERILGPYLGTAVNLFFAFYFIAVMAVLLRSYSEAIITSALPRTPISFLIITLTVGSIVSCWYGLESIARVARLSIPFIALGLIILCTAVLPEADPNNIFPLFSVDPVELFHHAIARQSVITEGLLAALLLPAFGGWRHFRRAGLLAVGTGGVLFLIIVFILTLVFGVQVSEEFMLPVYNLSRIIEFGRFFQRMESVFLLIWAMVGTIKMAVTLYGANLVLARIFRLPDYRPLLWITTLLCFSLSLLPADLMTALMIENDIVRSYPGLAITLGLPFFLLVVAKFRKAGGEIRDEAK